MCGCPQDITGLDPVGGPPDAAFEPPPCQGGPTVSCASTPARPLLLMGQAQTWKCTLPGPRGEDGAAALLGGSVVSGHSEVALELHADSATGEVRLTPKSVSRQAFSGGAMTAYLAAYWEGHDDQCTNVPLSFNLAGNVWVADERNGQILVLDSGGRQVGGPLAAEGIDSPRLVAALRPGEVLVGGKTAGETILAVFDNEGGRKRVLDGAFAIQTPLRAAAAVGTFGFISSGTAGTGVLYTTEGSGGPVRDDTTLAGGLASDGNYAFLGLINAGGYKRATTSSIPANVYSLSWKDSAGDSCDVLGITAMVHLQEGGFVIASRHARPGSTSPYGQLAVTGADMAMKASLWHEHSSPPGDLSPDGPYDWLEQLTPTVVIGAREGKPGVERIDLMRVPGGDLGPAPWSGALSGTFVTGLARLR